MGALDLEQKKHRKRPAWMRSNGGEDLVDKMESELDVVDAAVAAEEQGRGENFPSLVSAFGSPQNGSPDVRVR